MPTDTLSKQCVIIGSFGTALSLVSILLETLEFWVNRGSEYSDEHRSSYIRENAIHLGIYATSALFSILLIWGVLKRQHVLMTPWLLSAFAGVGYSIYFILTLPFAHLDFLHFCLIISGCETVILYPLCSEFRNIWHEKSEEYKKKVHLITYNKNMNSGFVDLTSKVAM